MGKAIFNSDPQQSIKKKNKSSQKQTVPKKPTAKDEEKAKKEAAKKAKEAEKAEAEKRRNAEIAARIAQATKRISSQHKQKDVNHQPSSVEPLQEDNVHPLSVPAFRKQKTSVFNPASTSSQEQPVNRKQTTIQAPRSSSHRQRDEPHHHSIYTEIHDDVHPLSLPAFRKQSLSTADPASASSQERPVNYRRQKTPQPTTNSSQRQQNGPHWQSNHTEIQEGDNVHPPSLPAFRKQSLCNGDPTSTSSQKQAAKRKHKTPQGPKNKTRKSCTADSATVPDASSKQPARKQLVTTHVVSDDDGNSDETLITTSCDNLDCKALLLENKSLKDKIRKLQNRLEIAGKGRV